MIDSFHRILTTSAAVIVVVSLILFETIVWLFLTDARII